MKRLWPWLVLISALAACIPPPGFARTPTPAPTLAPIDLCADYVRDSQRAVRELRQMLTAQVQEINQVAIRGQPPEQAVADRLSDRRDDLMRTAVIYERPAPCPEGEPPRAQLAVAAALIRQATNALNDALDSDSPAVFREAAALYQRALAELSPGTPAP
jgi:hypothetical protein